MDKFVLILKEFRHASLAIFAVNSCQVFVRQISVLGPILFTVYVSPIGHLINSHGVDYNSYADNMQLYTALQSDTGQGLDRLIYCLTRTNLMLQFLIQDRDSESWDYHPPFWLRAVQLP